ncbi:fibronectin type III domain-containing protein [Flavobacterium sp. MAH-1]|uniref:Fibronectin type III domain-containing protein n=1 Tax=Flavobacterium agri TaxID=2743471 RepID=A0A7Y8Y530_9FLAO|nr:zinc-dependent metalloprotease family protein [Flavobacterium agri]NUY81426.1 fibronectin type III domain-containing protein [Flavobacterium agri]NYA71450.1 fibronectin type III domain-containing protein [Flavobacterium agri]
MKNRLLSIAFVAITGFSFAQQGRQVWRPTVKSPESQIVANKTSIQNPRLFALNTDQLRQSLTTAPQRFSVKESNLIVSLPNADGGFDRFRVTEFSNMDPELAARYPEIRSYTGKGVDDPRATVYFSISPLGLQSMVINGDKSAVFIEPYTTDQSVYTVYKKSDKAASLNQWDCRVIQQATNELNEAELLRPNADDGNLRNYRLAMSVTGEYTAYFGGTKALALAAINNTMTRVNGVFEIDMGVHMNLISNTDVVIYTSASSDPYSNASTGAGGAWNQELQTTLTNNIGSANYDIGHLFGATGGGGNAGCIGCVCKNPTTSVPLGKGSGYTSPADGIPSGDNFDIDYVAHEMGHQFGGNHTFSMSNEGTIAQCEPGSGSTIMGYAGITGSTDVQAHSDAYFHAVSIQQITNYVKSTTCQTMTVTGNAIPTANAGADYTIPKGTPFILTGTGTDANGGALTYCWEQMDKRTTSNSMPSPTKTGGPAFRSYSPITSPAHMFPRLETVKTGATSWTWEAVPTVARTMNFRFTVRDNQGSFAANNSDDMVVTVNATAGPFTVSAPNTAVSYVGGSTQTVTWAVAGTTANGVNCANVDILLSTDGGNTFPTVLLAATPNDGSQAVTIPNTAGTQNRIMVKGTNHIFFDMSNANFTITAGSTDTVAPSAPTNLAASGTTSTTTNLSWTASTDNVAVTGYDVYRNGAFLASSATTSYAATGLTASTTYTFYVRAKDAAGNISGNSNTVSVTTSAAPADTTAPSAPTNLAASGTTQTATNLSWTASTDNVGVTGYDVYRNGSFLASTTTTSYAATGLTAATTYSFYVRAKDAAGNVSTNSNTVSVTTLSNSVTYCTSQGNNVQDELIGRVQFGTINNPSTGGTGYTNFTAISTNVTRGSAYTVTVTPTWTGSVYSEGYAVFIDWNQDGDFSDSGETAWTRTATTTTPVSGSITIPATAALGATRMRVSMKYNGVPTSCETFTYGQVEDYTVNIVSSARMDESGVAPVVFNVFPNPVKGEILNVTDVEDNTPFRIVNLLGQQILTGKVNGGAIQVGTVNAGTYLLEINSNVKRFVKQ